MEYGSASFLGFFLPASAVAWPTTKQRRLHGSNGLLPSATAIQEQLNLRCNNNFETGMIHIKFMHFSSVCLLKIHDQNHVDKVGKD